MYQQPYLINFSKIGKTIEGYISVAEKEYFENKGYQLPERCYPCRVKRRTADGSNAKTT